MERCLIATKLSEIKTWWFTFTQKMKQLVVPNKLVLLGMHIRTSQRQALWWLEFLAMMKKVIRLLQKTITCLLFSDRKSTRLNSSHVRISYAVFCLKKKKKNALYLYI